MVQDPAYNTCNRIAAGCFVHQDVPGIVVSPTYALKNTGLVPYNLDWRSWARY